MEHSFSKNTNKLTIPDQIPNLESQQTIEAYTLDRNNPASVKSVPKLTDNRLIIFPERVQIPVKSVNKHYTSILMAQQSAQAALAAQSAQTAQSFQSNRSKQGQTIRISTESNRGDIEKPMNTSSVIWDSNINTDQSISIEKPKKHTVVIQRSRDNTYEYIIFFGILFNLLLIVFFFDD